MDDSRGIHEVCSHKEAFENRGLALEHVKKLKKREGKTLVDYKCRGCGLWHVTGFGDSVKRISQGRKPKTKNKRRKIR